MKNAGKTSVFVVSAVVLIASFILVGCGNKVSIEQGRAKIAELAAMGVPEREMSTYRMYLHHMETAQRVGNSAQFRQYQDSLTRALAEFEERMLALLGEAGPFMDSVRKACDDKIAHLKGLHLEAAEKGKGQVDSLMGIQSQKMLARNRLVSWAEDLDTLVIQQHLADSLRSQFVGTWIMELESPDPNFKVVDRTEIHMSPDGSLFIMEGKRATNDNAREHWLFESTGTWDLKGDVAYHYITREKRVRQELEQRDERGRWTKQTQPPYDSAVAPGTKDRFASWGGLQEDYQRFPLQKKGTVTRN